MRVSRLIWCSFFAIAVFGSSLSGAVEEHHGGTVDEPKHGATPGASQGTATGQAGGHANYAGLQDRQIKSLSSDDIAELRRGSGWGLALPAELNGLPGPIHLLELQQELGLNRDQVVAIETLYQEMKAEAVVAGERFIDAEAALSQAFAAHSPAADQIQALLQEAAEARAELRYVHLSRHMETPELLSQDQLHKYRVLRGYEGSPCDNIPDGHNASMWRKHNGCD